MWHIFYNNSNKEIQWCTNGTVTSDIITEQQNAGLSYLSKDTDTTLTVDDYCVNTAGDDVVEKSVFNPIYSTITPSVDGVVNVTGLPTGTVVTVDGAVAGTMSDTTLTFTATEPGIYQINFSKDGYKKATGTKITVKRYGQ